jgi:hypothetical protein
MSPSLDSLPAELRLHIYDLVLPSIPLSAPRSQYAGLLYSKKLIRHELQSEILKRMEAFLCDIQQRCTSARLPAFHWETPTDLTHLYNLTVFRPADEMYFNRRDPFMALMYMNFHTLRIKTVPPTPLDAATAEIHAKWPFYLACVLLQLYKPNIQRIPVSPRLGGVPTNVTRFILWMTVTGTIGTGIISRRRIAPFRPGARSVIFDWSADPISKIGEERRTEERLRLADKEDTLAEWGVTKVWENEQDVFGIEYVRTEIKEKSDPDVKEGNTRKRMREDNDEQEYRNVETSRFAIGRSMF